MAATDRTFTILGAVFGTLGLAGVGVAAFLVASHLSFAASAVHATGVVLGEHERPQVRFQAGERTVEIRGSVRTRPPSFHDGETVDVLYPEGHPEEGEIDSFAQSYLGPCIAGPMGLVFGGVGAGMLLFVVRARRRRERAIRDGVRVTGKVSAVRLDRATRANGQSPWVVEATFTDADGKSFLFRSESVWLDPRPFYPVGGDATVYYLEDEPTVNALVLDKLPEAD